MDATWVVPLGAHKTMSKLEELALYITQKSQDDPKFGATKLNKILFWADFIAYAYLGKPITEATYIRRQHGPVPREIVRAIDNLVVQGRALMGEKIYFGKSQKRLEALDGPNLSLFTSNEIKFVDHQIKRLADWNATEVSDDTHSLRPWLDALQEEEIPYETVFVLLDTPVTLDDKAWGLERAKALNLL